MVELNRKVCKLLVQAQCASDAGKRIYELRAAHRTRLSYAGKDVYILSAIKTILKKKETGFSFYVTDGGEISPFLVYFDFYDEFYQIRQISFHSFDENLEKYISPMKHQREWDMGCSRDTAEYLLGLLQ